MASLEQIIATVSSYPGGVEAVAAESGVPVDTLIKIVKGYTTSPRYNTFIKLDLWFLRRAQVSPEAAQ
jgi:hypothetical protein